jgi:hypothetical protein
MISPASRFRTFTELGDIRPVAASLLGAIERGVSRRDQTVGTKVPPAGRYAADAQRDAIGG